jgi:hypothetical protein
MIGAALARALVVARADARPRDEIGVRCKAAHVNADLREDRPVHKVRVCATVGNHLRVGSFSKSQGEPSPMGSS